ncbi:hypothetical protein JZ751_025316 [Albula glossodonta]|uniref:Active regulator of SIRT1 n=1 Tax=Albula glossodonta TaxID=121402 RepID=A0A8T2NGL2_9TELE|nr:hypothetical protein JZ751_025316 [Albula glossodonta]
MRSNGEVLSQHSSMSKNVAPDIKLALWTCVIVCILKVYGRSIPNSKMSASMIRRGLELLSDDIKGVPGQSNQKAKNKQLSHQGGGRGEGGLMDQISSNRQGVTKQVRRLQGRLGAGKSKATVKDKHIKCAVDEFRKKQKQSQLSKNLGYFLGVGYKAEQADTHKILLQNRGRQSRNRPDRPVKRQKEQKSLFTEEEFQEFQKAYFGRTVEDSSK